MNDTLTIPGPDPVPADRAAAAPADETLVLDARATLTPAQFVERKLAGLLRATALPVSHMQTGRPTGR